MLHYVVKCYYINVFLLQDGWTPLHHACSNGRTEIVKFLVINHADISSTSNVSNKIVLILYNYVNLKNAIYIKLIIMCV